MRVLVFIDRRVTVVALTDCAIALVSVALCYLLVILVSLSSSSNCGCGGITSSSRWWW